MNTLRHSCSFNGVGIHSGQSVYMDVSPTSNDGITFYLTDKSQPSKRSPGIPASKHYMGKNHCRSTLLTNGTQNIHTPEHFLAACYALQLTRIQVILSHEELPILDGSAQPFIQSLGAALKPLPSDAMPKLTLKSDITFNWHKSVYHAIPSDDLCITAVLLYPHQWIKAMTHTHYHSLDQFKEGIAPARTYAFTHELAELKAQNLAKGGGLENALVVSDTGYLNDPRFSNELARHKILDFLGDMALGGHQLRGHFTLIRPSHQANLAFLNEIM